MNLPPTIRSLLLLFPLAAHLLLAHASAQPAEPPADAPAAQETYLTDFAAEARKDWPKNRTLRVVCLGNSVPAGYFKTPVVNSLQAYPHLLHKELAAKYPHAVINVVVAAIGGEDSAAGARRFQNDVLSLRPDVVTIDYALTDRALGMDAARSAWESMISQAKADGVKVILLTPTPEKTLKLNEPTEPLNQHAAQIRVLARRHGLAVADSAAVFRNEIKDGRKLESLLSAPNHPNAAGHALVAKELARWFP